MALVSCGSGDDGVDDGETGEVKESTTVAGAAERKADDIKATVDEMTDDANESVDVSDVLLD